MTKTSYAQASTSRWASFTCRTCLRLFVSVMLQVAAKVVRVGPTDQARVHLVYNTPGSGPRQAQLQRAIGLQLLHSILVRVGQRSPARQC